MFENYWNYPLYLWNYIKRLFKGNPEHHKFYIGKYGYDISDYDYNRLKLIKIRKGYYEEDLDPVIHSMIYFRLWWNDGSKSHWYINVPGNASIASMIGDSHSAEALVLNIRNISNNG